ncbi:DUF3604 domain-containing protein [Porticoccaceae bacterium]|nr:DUF3604 domain-containing protein [Porticoccaceae bacterium]MDC1513634.1 DUF3604 domain-containing protein [Porticoccaceae bacterium]
MQYEEARVCGPSSGDIRLIEMEKTMKSKTATQTAIIPSLIALLFSVNALAGDSYSPFADQNFPESVYWGDTHLHTNLSLDANAFGNKTLTADDAYRFARGEP